MNRKSSSKHATEVLWSRSNIFYGNQRFESDSPSPLSEKDSFTSCSSYDFDEFEAKSVKRIKASLDAMESALYDGKPSPLLSDELSDECQKWSTRFSHLKLEGNSLPPGLISKVPVPSPPTDEICLSAKQIQYVPSEEHAESNFSSLGDVLNDQSNAEKWDKYLASSKSNGVNDVIDLPQPEITPLPVEHIKEKIIVQLAARVWADVILTWKGKKESGAIELKENERLPPINSSYKRRDTPKSRDRQRTPSETPKLEGILTVSPKILLNKPEIRNTSISRPNTGASAVSSKLSAKSALPRHPVLPRHPMEGKKKSEDCDGVKSQMNQAKRAIEHDLDLIKLYLPVLEEDGFEQLGTGLKGMHIEPESRDDLYRFHAPKNVQLTLRPPSLLPPIDISSYIPVYSNDENPLPNFYVSPDTIRRRKTSSPYDRHLSSIRPSTTRTNKSPKPSSYDGGKTNRQSSPLYTSVSGNPDGDFNLLPYHCNKYLNTAPKFPLPSNIVSLFPKVAKSIDPSEIFKKSTTTTKPNKPLGALNRKASR